MLMCFMSLPLRCPILCERDFVISVCQMWHVLLFLFLLFNDPDVAMEHTDWTLSCRGPSPALLLNHCASEALYRNDCTTFPQTARVRRLCLEQGGDEDAIHFLFPLELLNGTLVCSPLSVYSSVIGGKEEQMTYVPACYLTVSDVKERKKD